MPTPLNNGIITFSKYDEKKQFYFKIIIENDKFSHTHESTGPLLANCPTDNSKNIIGIPTRTKNMKNGIKNAPK